MTKLTYSEASELANKVAKSVYAESIKNGHKEDVAQRHSQNAYAKAMRQYNVNGE